MSDAIIRCESLWKIYRNNEIEVAALRGVNLSVAPGDFVSIMGASGSGKSTLMNIIGCLDTITSGSYFLNGRDVSSLSKNQLAQVRNQQIGFVFQSFQLLPRLSALQNVELPLVYARRPAKERRAIASTMLERVGLARRMHHRPNQLSGGQMQRVAIARAIINNPAIVLADEPTGNLDTLSSEEIMKVFTALNRSGVTIVLVTHEEDIAEYSSRVVRFRDGEIIQDVRLKPLPAQAAVDGPTTAEEEAVGA